MGLKAYACTEDCEGTGGIIFAQTNLEARKSASNIWGDGELAGWNVHRAPGLDKYHAKGVPTWVLIADGWNFECNGCGMRMDETSLEDEGLSVEGVVGKENGWSFCSHQCRTEYKSRRAAADAFGEAFLDMMKDRLRDRFHGQDLCFGDHQHHVYVPMWNEPLAVDQAWVSFSYPGAKYGAAHLKYEKNGERNEDQISCGRWFYSVPNGDVPAYEEWAAKFPRKGYI